MSLSEMFRHADSIEDSVEKELSAYSPRIRQLLYNRGITKGKDAEFFLNPDYENHLHNPFLLTDMEKSVERILHAIEKDEPIVIYSDYDCDGIPGGVLLHDFLSAISFTHFKNYIPHRHDEGYGFNADAARTLSEEGAKLIITVDCGITDHAAVEEANKHGVDVIITDHHEPGDELPHAFAVINPKRDNAYPFNGLCGTGVAFKLVQALIEKGNSSKQITLTDGWEKWWLDMVGIATIADMVPLVDENRALAHYGLHVLRKSRRPGLQHLLRKTRVLQRHINEDDIGFTIGPRINAASRMDTPEDAFHMLATKDEGEAGKRVAHLERLNNERRGVVAAMTKELKKRMEAYTDIPEVIVFGDPIWRPALVGLAAQSLVEGYDRPVFLWGRDGKGIIKGSCRSNGAMSVYTLMEKAKDAFLEYGGHHASGGFSVSEDDIHTLSDRLNDAYKSVKETKEEMKQQIIDLQLTLDEVNNEFMKEIERLAPFGVGNPKPLIVFEDVTPKNVLQFGKAKEHLKLEFDRANDSLEAIAFFSSPERFTKTPKEGERVTLVGHVERSHFMNRMTIRVRIVDVV